MRYLKKPLILFIVITSYSCKNQHLLTGKLKNLSGMDGCSWIIELDGTDKNGNKKLEPTNLNKFKITLQEGQQVKLKYKDAPVMSTCMTGKPVELEMIRDK
jgi:hypothetical protein